MNQPQLVDNFSSDPSSSLQQDYRPSDMTPHQDEVIQQVAKFVIYSADSARFQKRLVERTKHNHNFAFLEESHSHNRYYVYLLEAYKYWKNVQRDEVQYTMQQQQQQPTSMWSGTGNNVAASAVYVQAAPAASSAWKEVSYVPQQEELAMPPSEQAHAIEQMPSAPAAQQPWPIMAQPSLITPPSFQSWQTAQDPRQPWQQPTSVWQQPIQVPQPQMLPAASQPWQTEAPAAPMKSEQRDGPPLTSGQADVSRHPTSAWQQPIQIPQSQMQSWQTEAPAVQMKSQQRDGPPPSSPQADGSTLVSRQPAIGQQGSMPTLPDGLLSTEELQPQRPSRGGRGGRGRGYRGGGPQHYANAGPPPRRTTLVDEADEDGFRATAPGQFHVVMENGIQRIVGNR